MSGGLVSGGSGPTKSSWAPMSIPKPCTRASPSTSACPAFSSSVPLSIVGELGVLVEVARRRVDELRRGASGCSESPGCRREAARGRPGSGTRSCCSRSWRRRPRSSGGHDLDVDRPLGDHVEAAKIGEPVLGLDPTPLDPGPDANAVTLWIKVWSTDALVNMPAASPPGPVAQQMLSRRVAPRTWHVKPALVERTVEPLAQPVVEQQRVAGAGVPDVEPAQHGLRVGHRDRGPGRRDDPGRRLALGAVDDGRGREADLPRRRVDPGLDDHLVAVGRSLDRRLEVAGVGLRACVRGGAARRCVALIGRRGRRRDRRQRHDRRECGPCLHARHPTSSPKRPVGLR